MAGMRLDNPRAAHGFTLTEVVMVVTIVGIIAGLAVPRFAGAIARRQATSAAQRILLDVALARHHARITSASVTLHFDGASSMHTPDSGVYWIDGVPDPDNPNERYEVRLNEAPYHVGNVIADLGGDTEIIYDMYGAPDSGGTVTFFVGSYRQRISIDADTGKGFIVENHGVTVPVNTSGLPAV